jgi:protein gp37
LLEAPFHWKKPQRVFTCSMSDLFHSDIPKDFLLQVFDTMKKCSQHTFLILTKRAERLTVLSPTIEWSENIWMGVTVEEDRFKDRIDELRTTGAKHKFISAEPLLSGLGSLNLTGIDWIFVGGESGENSRPIEEDWFLNIRDQCLLHGNYYHEMPPVMRD